MRAVVIEAFSTPPVVRDLPAPVAPEHGVVLDVRRRVVGFIAGGPAHGVGVFDVGGAFFRRGVDAAQDGHGDDLVPVLQAHVIHAVPVDVGAVQGAGVGDLEGPGVEGEAGVAPGDRDVVQEDVRVRVAPGDDAVIRLRGVRIQQEAGAAVRAGLGDQQRRIGGQGRDGGGLLVGQAAAHGALLRRVDPDDGGLR